MRQLFASLSALPPSQKKEPTLLNELFAFMGDVKRMSGGRFAIGTVQGNPATSTLMGVIMVDGRKSDVMIRATRHEGKNAQFRLCHAGKRDLTPMTGDEAENCVAQLRAISSQQVWALPRQLSAQRQMQ